MKRKNKFNAKKIFVKEFKKTWNRIGQSIWPLVLSTLAIIFYWYVYFKGWTNVYVSAISTIIMLFAVGYYYQGKGV